MISFSKLIETLRFGTEGAGCIILAKNTGKLLIPLRSKKVLEPNTWGIWGGKMDDDDESPEKAVRREVKEESGYLGNLDLIKLTPYKEQNFIYHNFLGIVDKQFVPRLNEETTAYRWVQYGDWPEPLHYGLKYLIETSGPKIKSEIDKLSLTPSDKNEITIYRGVNSKFGDINHGIQSIGIKNKLVGALGPNYVDNEDIAKRYGNKIIKRTISANRIIELSHYDDVMRLYAQYEDKLPRNLARDIKNSEGKEQFEHIKNAANILRSILSKKYDAIQLPLGPGDAKYLSSLGLVGNLFILLI